MIKINQYIPQSITHPGEILEEKLEEMEMSKKEFALRTGKPERTIIAVIQGESSITADMAVLFEKITLIPANFWLNGQRIYDEFIAKEKYKENIKAEKLWIKNFPIADMIKKGWLPSVENITDKISALLSYFNFAGHTEWENYYFNQELKTNFRISLAHISKPYAISAWLRKGELQAIELQAKDYSKDKLITAIPQIKSIIANQPDDFLKQLQNICLQAGVKVVYTPCIKDASINGATRWIHNTPLIQLSDRYKRNDIFWFTFFHEIGHILLHGKKDIFLEHVIHDDKDRDKEKQSDEFATKCVLNAEEEQKAISTLPFNEQKMIKLAKELNTHPGIIVGRLQHKHFIPNSVGTQLIKKITID